MNELYCSDSRSGRLTRTAFFLLMIAAGLGEWKPLNRLLYGLPKAFTLGVIGIALVSILLRPALDRLRFITPPTLMHLSLMAALLLWSCVIWILQLSGPGTILRGCSKIGYQTIALLTASAAVYLFGSKAIDLFTVSISLVNGIILLLEIPNYGLGGSLRSLIVCILTFGNAEGYARQLEIHDLTFVFGQLVLYYAAFAPHDPPAERSERRRFLLLCLFFFLTGMKRIAIPAIILFTLAALLLKDRKNPGPLLRIGSIGFIVLFLLYIYGIRTGAVAQLFHALDIDAMGREHIWQMAGDYYEFSAFHLGHGFEFVDSIISQWYSAGLINHPYPFHNDILKVFVELGMPGFLLWAGLQYVLYPHFWLRYAGTSAALLYCCELGYMSLTYLTDNSAFYFWSTLALRLIVLSYASRQKIPPASPAPNTW